MITCWALLTENKLDKTYTLVDIFDTHSEAEIVRREKPGKYILSKLSTENVLTNKVNGRPLNTPDRLIRRWLNGE